MSKPYEVECFFEEGRDAWGECVDRQDCPYLDGTDGRFGWLFGWDTAQKFWEGQLLLKNRLSGVLHGSAGC